ncbi:hypothetical protein FS842_005146 [Serendipita sp. 407]|nr:hypothetical protein FS842_005146 [Serendipita sp. 407]
MATLLPPPKRRKLYHGVPEPEPKPETPVPNIVVQFINDEDGKDLAPAVTLPADLSREQLETLLNKLSGSDDPVPFSFHVSVPGASEGEDVTATAPPTRIVIANSLNQDVLLNTKYKMTTEDIFVVHCSPQAVFKVRPATRCSSTLTGHSSAILCASFSPTGQMLATGKQPSSDEEAQAWAMERYRKLASQHSELMISGSDDHTLFLWNLFASGSSDDTSAETSANGTKPKPLMRLTGHQRQISHVVFSPDGTLAASASWDSSVRLWNGRTGKRVLCHNREENDIDHSNFHDNRFIATMRGHVGAVYRLTWSADSRMLVSASKDSTVKIWDLKTYKLKMDLPGHTDEVYCVDFVADKILPSPDSYSTAGKTKGAKDIYLPQREGSGPTKVMLGASYYCNGTTNCKEDTSQQTETTGHPHEKEGTDQKERLVSQGQYHQKLVGASVKGSRKWVGGRELVGKVVAFAKERPAAE